MYVCSGGRLGEENTDFKGNRKSITNNSKHDYMW